jgi:hypothetical protein
MVKLLTNRDTAELIYFWSSTRLPLITICAIVFTAVQVRVHAALEDREIAFKEASRCPRIKRTGEKPYRWQIKQAPSLPARPPNSQQKKFPMGDMACTDVSALISTAPLCRQS